MAYMDFSADALLGAAQDSPPPAAMDGGRLSALEWTVVALAQRDRISSLAEPGRLATALGSVFGLRRTPRLADPRLEALRRMAVLSWHRGFSVPVDELKAFFKAGFSTAQYETLLDSISAARSRMRARA